MKTRGEEFIDFLGNGKTCHELDSELEDLELDEDWEECKITPADELNFYNRTEKGGLNENGKRN